jgi:hypothetical protein
MTTDTQRAKLTAEHESYLKTIIDGVVEGIAEGAREGLSEGLKKGAKDALEACLFQGPESIDQEDIKDLLEAIPQAVIKASVIKGVKPILKQTAELYLKRACQKLIAELKAADAKPSREQIGLITELIQKSQQKAVEQIVKMLPQNPLFGAIADGLRTALEESLGKSLADCQASLQKELAAE